MADVFLLSFLLLTPVTLEALIYKGERVIRIELTYDAWEAPALPLSYTRSGVVKSES